MKTENIDRSELPQMDDNAWNAYLLGLEHGNDQAFFHAESVRLIAQERKEQFEKHGRTIERDVVENKNGQLLEGATWLIGAGRFPAPLHWDQDIWNHMISKPHKERLIIAGALIAAEIDRLQNS